MQLSDAAPKRIEAWLDARGRSVWIIAMVLGFILFWPVGLAVLLRMLWRGRTIAGAARAQSRAEGNAAFAAHRAETLRQLDEDAAAFEAHLAEEEFARDRAEFERFKAARSR